MTAIVADDEEGEIRENMNIGKIKYKTESPDSEILFYVEDVERELTKVTDFNKKRKARGFIEPTDASDPQEMESSKFMGYPIRRSDLQKNISNLYSAFNELFKNNGPNPEEPQGGIEGIKGYSLEEIELNLDVKVGATVFFSLHTEGSAGVKLVFKRK